MGCWAQSDICHIPMAFICPSNDNKLPLVSLSRAARDEMVQSSSAAGGPQGCLPFSHHSLSGQFVGRLCFPQISVSRTGQYPNINLPTPGGASPAAKFTGWGGEGEWSTDLFTLIRPDLSVCGRTFLSSKTNVARPLGFSFFSCTSPAFNTILYLIIIIIRASNPSQQCASSFCWHITSPLPPQHPIKQLPSQSFLYKEPRNCEKFLPRKETGFSFWNMFGNRALCHDPYIRGRMPEKSLAMTAGSSFCRWQLSQGIYHALLFLTPVQTRSPVSALQAFLLPPFLKVKASLTVLASLVLEVSLTLKREVKVHSLAVLPSPKFQEGTRWCCQVGKVCKGV